MEVIYGNVQSGSNYLLSIGAKPTDDDLSHDPGTIIVSVCSKYTEMCSCLTRTLILDGTQVTFRLLYTCFIIETFIYNLVYERCV